MMADSNDKTTQDDIRNFNFLSLSDRNIASDTHTLSFGPGVGSVEEGFRFRFKKLYCTVTLLLEA